MGTHTGESVASGAHEPPRPDTCMGTYLISHFLEIQKRSVNLQQVLHEFRP